MPGMGAKGAVLSSCLLLSLATGCMSYRISTQSTEMPGITIGLPDGKPDYVVVRVENPSDGFLFVDWGDVRLRGPDAFEIPAKVVPGTPLEYIHPNSAVEYHVHAVHQYRHPDSVGQRRNSLASSLAPDTRLNEYRRRSQVVDATNVLNTSPGVLQSSVCRGRPFS